LIVEAGDCWDVHHVAVLLGYGAGAVCPWLALSTARAVQPENGTEELVRALELGLLKVLSKMGISTVTSYRAGQLFEVVGLADAIVERCFTGTPSRIGGITWEELHERIAARHTSTVGADVGATKLPDYGQVRYRRGDQAEVHAWQPTAVRALQRAVGAARKGEAEPDAGAWSEFNRLATGEVQSNLRDLLDLVAAGPALTLDEVEPAESIVRRFVISAMSLGALSPEAHLTLTIAMNRLGARSNTGEGGEDPAHYVPTANGDRADCKIKQVASGRFGVTAPKSWRSKLRRAPSLVKADSCPATR
jgi:glutamate synthase (NADPH/NADH) large chain